MSSQESVSPKPKKKTGRFKKIRRLFLLMIVLLIVLTVVAPKIIARTFLCNYLLSQALTDVDGKVTVESASLGWFAPVEAQNLNIVDSQGQTILNVPHLRMKKTLLGLLLDSDDLGKIDIQRPVANLALRGKTSNFEQVFAAYLKPSDKEKSTSEMELVCNDAVIHVHDLDRDKKWTLKEITLHARQGEETIHAQLQATLPQGRLKANVDAGKEKGKADVDLEGFPLALAEAILRRFEPEMELAGNLNVSLQGQWESGKAGIRGSANGMLTTKNFHLRHARLEKDQLDLNSLELPFSIRMEDDVLHVKQAKLTCDLGTAQVLGKIHLAQSLPANLRRPGYFVDVDVDLAKLANALPHTLKLQDDLIFTQGRFHANLRSMGTEKGILWQGNVTTSDLAAKRGEQTISWKEPMTLEIATLHQEKGLPIIRKLESRSSFLSLDASGSANKLTVLAKYDLDRLTRELSQFVDPGELKLAGRGETLLTLKLEEDRILYVDSTSTLNDFQLTVSPEQKMQEKQIVLNVSAKAEQKEDIVHLRAAKVQADLAQDHFQFTLSEPVVDVTTLPWGTKANVVLKGDLKRWQGRLRPFVSAMNSFLLFGQGTVTAECQLKRDRLLANKVKVQANRFLFDGYGLHINEASVNATTDGEVNLASGSTTFRKLELLTPVTTMTAEKLEILTEPEQPVLLVGDVVVKGTVDSTLSWFGVTQTRTYGSLDAKVKLSPDQKKIGMDVRLAIKDFIKGSPVTPDWKEPMITLNGKLAYDENGDLLDLDRMVFTSRLVNGTMAGQLTELGGKQKVNVGGSLSYNLRNLTPMLREQIGPDLQIDGKGSRPYRIVASLSDPNVLKSAQGEIGLHWDRLSAQGCECGNAEVRALLKDGSLRANPVSFTLNEGRVNVVPTLRLDPDPMELRLEKGRVVDHAKLTPAMERALKYALPVTSGLTEAKGEISLTLEDCRIPFAEGKQSFVKGTLSIHSAQIGGSALVREIGGFLRVNPVQVQLGRGSQVQFWLDKGWVHHRNLEIVFPNFKVRTNGAVRLDGTLSMVAEMPVPANWKQGRTLSKVLEDRKILIPIEGTLSQPRLNRNVWQHELELFARDAAKELLKKKANEGLKKLLPEDLFKRDR